MKNKNEKRNSTLTLIKEAAALFLITLFSGLALSYIYETTKEPIAEQQIIKSEKANQAVFPDAISFTEDEELMQLAKDTDLTLLNSDYEGVTIDNISKALDQSNQTIGYNITVTTTTGYKDPITIVIGYSKDGKVKGIEITAINETAGLGMLAKEPKFLGQFNGKTVSRFQLTKTGATSEEQIDAISGATITSRAVTNAINIGISFLNEFAAESGGGQNE